MSGNSVISREPCRHNRAGSSFPFLLLLLLSGCRWVSPGAEVRQDGLFSPANVIGAATFVATVVGIIVMIVLRDRRQKSARPFPYFFENHDLDRLKRVLFPGKRIEDYVERSQLRTAFGPTLLPPRSRILIYGLSGVGKTREGFELIRRLGKKAVYLCTTGSPEVPSCLEREHARQKVVLFLDNLRVSSEPSAPEENQNAEEQTNVQIERVLEFFSQQTELHNVVVTMTTQEFEKLRAEPDSAPILDQFTVIHLKALESGERSKYIEDLATFFTLTLDRDICQPLSNADVSLNDLYDWMERLSSRSDKAVTECDVHELLYRTKAIWRQNYADLSSVEKKVFDSLAVLYAASIPLFEDVAIELALQGHGWWRRVLRRPRLRNALRDLARRYLTIEHGQVYCADYRLRADEPRAATIREALIDLMPRVRRLVRRRTFAARAVRVLEPLSRSLGEQGLPREMIAVNGLILALPRRLLGADPARTRSAARFHQGIGYYRIGRRTWPQAQECYLAAIHEDNTNPFPKHALATLFCRGGRTDQALRWLDEIVATDSSDLIALKTRLEILSEGGSTKEARRADRALHRSLRGMPADPKTLSAELACVRHSATVAERLQDSEAALRAKRAASGAISRYERLLARIPGEMTKLEAVVRNSYGCFLYDVLSRSDAGLAQLERALHAWPAHEHTLHKLAAVYLDEAEVRSDERDSLVAKAKSHLARLLEVHPRHYAARHSLARLEAEAVCWAAIDENLFWPKVAEIYAKYRASHEPEVEGSVSLHNSMVHHSTGCFLWHVEACAHKRGLSASKPASIPAADSQLRKSVKAILDPANELRAVIKSSETRGQRLSRSFQNQLILGLYTLGTYLFTVAADRPEVRKEGQTCLGRADELSMSTGSTLQFYSSNSFAESFVGKLRLSMGDRTRARELLESAVARFDRNWRAWWFLGRVNELDGRIEDALECFETAATGQGSPSLFGQLRSIVQKMKAEAATLEDKLRYSTKAYELDPTGDLSPKNLSDYGYDLYQKGKTTNNLCQLQRAEEVLLRAHEKYTSAGAAFDSNFPLWYAGEARYALCGHIEEVSLKRYIEAAQLSGREIQYTRLRDKVVQYSKPIWQRREIVGDDIVDRVEACAKLHLEYNDALLMAGITLQRNRQNRNALPYLERARRVKDTSGLRALGECYAFLGRKQEAEEVFYELLPLLPIVLREKLEGRITTLRSSGGQKGETSS